jgi:hypothetical protein
MERKLAAFEAGNRLNANGPFVALYGRKFWAATLARARLMAMTENGVEPLAFLSYAHLRCWQGRPMTARSRYDELHDRYHAILTTKAGTRYERLAALVVKILENRNVVIHDLKLLGDPSVAHHM